MRAESQAQAGEQVLGDQSIVGNELLRLLLERHTALPAQVLRACYTAQSRWPVLRMILQWLAHTTSGRCIANGCICLLASTR